MREAQNKNFPVFIAFDSAQRLPPLNKLVASFPKNKFEEVRVQVKEFKGYDLVDLRVYTAVKEGEEKVPTGKGLSINVSHFEELKKAILELESVLRENHLLE